MGIQAWKDPRGEKAGCVFSLGEGAQANGSWCCGAFVVPRVLGWGLLWCRGVVPVALREPRWAHQVRGSILGGRAFPPGHRGAEQGSRTCSHLASLAIRWDELSGSLGVAVTVLGIVGD